MKEHRCAIAGNLYETFLTDNGRLRNHSHRDTFSFNLTRYRVMLPVWWVLSAHNRRVNIRQTRPRWKCNSVKPKQPIKNFQDSHDRHVRLSQASKLRFPITRLRSLPLRIRVHKIIRMCPGLSILRLFMLLSSSGKDFSFGFQRPFIRDSLPRRSER